MGCARQGVDFSKVVGKRGWGVHESQLSLSVHGKQPMNAHIMQEPLFI